MNAKKNWMLTASVACCCLITLFLYIWLNDQYKMESYRLRKTAVDDVNRTVEKVTGEMMYHLILLNEPFQHENLPLNKENQQAAGKESVKWTYRFSQSPEEKLYLVDTSLKSETAKRIVRRGTDSSSVSIIIQNSDTTLYRIPADKKADKKKAPGKLTIKRMDVVQKTAVLLDNRRIDGDSQVKGLFSKGLRVFVNQLADANTGGDITKVTQQKLDTTLFSKQLRANWSNKQLNYNVAYHPKTSKGKNDLLFARTFDKPIQITLTNLTTNAFKAIVPQLIFAVFFLLILGASFAWMYRSWKKQVELNTLRMDFVHNMTHELKTPVSTVKVALEALNRYNRREDPKVVEEYLQLMEHEINRLDILVDNVMTNSWAEAKELLTNKTPVNVVSELTVFVERLRKKTDWKNAIITWEPLSDEVFLSWDIFHMEGVFNNLADNALKYAGPQVQLLIRLKTEKNKVSILFADNGPGIPENYRQEVFSPFVRVPQGDIHNVKGNGLGLSYCRKVMEAHNGKIEYISNGPFEGATFELQFNV